MTRPFARRLLAGVDGFAAVSALFGGLMVVTGVPYQFPMSWLNGTPFTSYLIPGLILGVVVGGSATVAAIATLRSATAGAYASFVAGVVMIGWIVGEILILQIYTWLQAVYFLVGAVMVALSTRLLAGESRRTMEVNS